MSLIHPSSLARRRTRRRDQRRTAALWLGAGLVLALLGQQVLASQQNTGVAFVLYAVGVGLLALLVGASENPAANPELDSNETVEAALAEDAGPVPAIPESTVGAAQSVAAEEPETPEPVPTGPQPPYARYIVPGLVGILLVAAILRFVGLDWDADQHLHPDERFITMVETKIRLPAGVGEYFNTG